MLRIRTFGGCHVERNGTRLDELSGQRKTLACLAVLAGVGDRGISRERITAMLWPESDDAHARRSLKQLVHSLRQRTGLTDLLLPAGDLRLNPACVSSDAGEFREARNRADHALAAAIYAGPFLDGFFLRGADGFERWVSEERASFARDFGRSVETLAMTAEKRGDRRAAIEWWRRLTIAEPLSAGAAVSFMRALDAVGERASAISHAQAFQVLISAELQSGPDASVAELAERLRTAPQVEAHASVSEPSPTAALAEPSLVVLPFVNTSGDAADEPFTDGLTDELIGAIGKLSGLTVVGRTSAFAFKGKQLDVSAIGEKLRVSSVLEGSVRRAGGRLKIGAQLLRAADGAVVWSEVYDRAVKDVFAVQAEIAQSIATTLRVKLSPAPFAAATTDVIAHELYLQGRHFQNRVSESDLQRSVAYFQQAIAQDPQYAEAYAGLADALLLLAILGNGPPTDLVGRAHAAIARALAIDSSLAEPRTSLASILFGFDWDWAAAGREFERAIALDPRYGLAHPRYGLYLMYLGRFDEGQRVLENAFAADPLSPSASMNLGRVHLCAGRPERAIPFLQGALTLNPYLALAHEQLGHAYLQSGMPDQALASFQRLSRLGTSFGSTRFAYGLAAAGREHEAEAKVRELIDASRERHVSPFGLAMVHVGLRDANGAFHWLERACDERDAFVHTTKTAPPFQFLQSDTRWELLLARLGFASHV